MGFRQAGQSASGSAHTLIAGSNGYIDATAANIRLGVDRYLEFDDDGETKLGTDAENKFTMDVGAVADVLKDQSSILTTKHSLQAASSVNLGGGTQAWKRIFASEYLELDEMTAPSGSANHARLYAVDNGSGKTQLVVVFGTGAAQVLATEP